MAEIQPPPEAETKPEPEPTPAPAVPAPAPAETPAAPEPAPAAAAPAEPAPVAETPAEPAAPAADYTFSAARTGNGAVALAGDVPADAAKAYFGVVAGDVPTTGLSVVEGAPEGFTAAATAGLRAMILLTDSELKFADGAWSLTGKAPDEEALASANGLIAALSNASAWQLDIAGPPAIEVCRAGVKAFSAGHQILFQSGSAKLTDESLAALGDLAAVLAKCPDAIVHVEGHTDSDGAESANLALSVARSEAVIDVLTSKGIAAERLYAIGYGETLPVASNDTAAGKQKNRRIVFSVLEK
jgi:outer membrane protein OmpA-like peptidoglycan-associated protein